MAKKNIKKLFALILAVAMVMSLSVNVFAAYGLPVCDEETHAHTNAYVSAGTTKQSAENPLTTYERSLRQPLDAARSEQLHIVLGPCCTARPPWASLQFPSLDQHLRKACVNVTMSLFALGRG